ncbi:MAG: hypothetical protein DDT32_01616 [Syntrophomonadaceae bacterium]|nr:hypothetical protein [Bacillota bacterium]
MPRKKSLWLDSAKAEAFNCGTHILIKTNLRPPKLSILSAPGQPMPEWDPRGTLARTLWNQTISDALCKIKYKRLQKAIVLTVVRSKTAYPPFDPTNVNSRFALEAMENCGLIAGVAPGQMLYGAIGCVAPEVGIDFYVGPPEFIAEMLQITNDILGVNWGTEEMGSEYFLTAAPREGDFLNYRDGAPPRKLPFSDTLSQISGKTPEASLSIAKTHILLKTNIHPPQVGIPVPQTFLPFSLYAPWVKEARGIWVDILEKACAPFRVQTIKKAVVVVVFRTQNPYFEPTNYDTRIALNTLVSLRLIADDSYDHLAYFAIAMQSRSGGGLDLYVGTPAFLVEITKIRVLSAWWLSVIL